MQALTKIPLRNIHMQRQPASITTNLYEIIEAVSAQITSKEQYLLTPAVKKLLKDCNADYVFKGAEGAA